MPEQPVPVPDDDTDLDQTGDVAALRAEAAGRRRQLRDAEAQIEQMSARLDAADRREVRQLAEAVLVDPDDYTASLNVDDVRGEDGAVDPEKVQAQLDALAEAKPHWVKREQPTPPPAMPDLHQGVRRDAGDQPRTLGDALRAAVQR